MYEKKGGKHYTGSELQASLKAIRQALKKRGKCILPVTGNSMEPTLLSHDRVVIEKVHKVEPGDVVAAVTPQGVQIHRVVAVKNEEVFTAGDSQLLAEVISKKDILGQVRGKLDLKGSFMPLPEWTTGKVQVIPLCFTLVGVNQKYMQVIERICKKLDVTVQVVGQNSSSTEIHCFKTLDNAIKEKETTIGVHPLASREADSLNDILGDTLHLNLNFILGADYGFLGNTLSLMPHTLVDHIVRIGSLSEQPVMDHVTSICYLTGLVRGWCLKRV